MQQKYTIKYNSWVLEHKDKDVLLVALEMVLSLFIGLFLLPYQHL